MVLRIQWASLQSVSYFDNQHWTLDMFIPFVWGNFALIFFWGMEVGSNGSVRG